MILGALPGFVLTRAIPAHLIPGIISGLYRVCGGVIRQSGSGRIVAHLIDASGAPALINTVLNVGALATGSINGYQLERIGAALSGLKDQVSGIQHATDEILRLSKGTAVLSGLTLSMGAAGFYFLNAKIKQVENRLEEVAKEVKAIRHFLELRQRAELAHALRTLLSIGPNEPETTRLHLLSQAYKTLGELQFFYREQLQRAEDYVEAIATEEFYTVTTIALARCAAELGRFDPMVIELSEAHTVWKSECRRITKRFVSGKEGDKLLTRKYLQCATSDELVDWMDFTSGENRGLGWIDNLRSRAVQPGLLERRPSKDDQAGMTALRKFCARARVYEGYESQAQLVQAAKIRPSESGGELEPPDVGSSDEFRLFVRSEDLSTAQA